MGTKIFLDTNIILDILDDKRPFHVPAVELFSQIETGSADAYISESIITTTDYIIQKNLTKAKRVTLFTNLLQSLTILPCSIAICQKALAVNFNDLEDAVLYQIALENGMDYFVSNDAGLSKKLSIPLLPAINVKALLKILG
jgi:predicted nucleic acid-binding protein